MELENVVGRIPGFNEWSHSDKIRLLAWYLHVKGRSHFGTGDIGRCFDDLHLPRPANASQLLTQLAEQKHLLKTGQSYRLAKEQRERFDAQYGVRDETVIVDQILAELPSKLQTDSCREYLDEALTCFRHQAFRAAVIMTWNVTYGYLVTRVVDGHLPQFNSQLSTMFGGKKKAIVLVEDFQRMKESEVLEVCNASAIVSKEVAKVLSSKLQKRNSAAHPSGSSVDKLQAEAYISDLVKNGLLKL